MGPTSIESFKGSVGNRLRLHSADDNGEASAGPVLTAELVHRVRLQGETARNKQTAWAAESIRDRLKVLKQFRLRIAAEPESLAVSVNRKNIAETLAAEVLPLLDACRYLETEAAEILREKTAGNRSRPKWLWGNSVVLRPEPLGVVLIIGPSNYPLMLPGIQALQAIAAGNAVLIKPAVGCSQVADLFASLAASAGLPEGLIQVLPESPEAATLAIRNGVNKVFLTGSASTGRAVRGELANAGTPSVMELSGCDAVFILEDADLNLVSDCLMFGLTLNNSRTCMAPRRVFATGKQTDEIIRLLKKKMALGSEQGSGSKERSCSIGNADRPLSDIADLKIREAISNGAALICGPSSDSSLAEYSGVAILDHVTSEMSVTQSDIFAPVLSFIRVESAEQALYENQKCPYALSATVFGSTERSWQFARRISVGCVVINDMIVPTADPRVPFGGRGLSGHGMTRGESGLLEMTQLKAIVATRHWFRPHLQKPTSADAEVLAQLIRLEHAATPLQSLMAVPRMIRATLKQIKIRRSHRT
ncbi:MAG: aldehyde dehydrogenase family protein [Planctomyces sp.]|nr:aldehyde dehydrogenase family protein [Planctomyces sp.]